MRFDFAPCKTGLRSTRNNFGRKHGRYKIYTTADEFSEKSLSCDEPFHGLHVEDGAGKSDQHLARGVWSDHGHQTPRAQKRQGVSDAG